MGWDKERTDRLLELHLEGKTAGEIGAVLGVTRNAVIGKLHRLGMARKKLAAAQKAEAPPVTEPPKEDPPAPEEQLAPEEENDDQEVVEDPVPEDHDSLEAHRQSARHAEEVSPRISLMELSSKTCKWPVGDPATDDFWFCGLPSQPNKPYCSAHNNLACQPPASRRDRKHARKTAMRPLRS